jgi:meso-butanediol dehydrogenase/(S,S)-butanediol dehydrogenase/diacetyl reductase
VTGGSSGIGKAIANEYVENGADVIIAGISESKGESVADELGCEFIGCDVRDYDAVVNLVDETAQRHGSLDVVINNAGVGSESTLGNMELDEWRDFIQTNIDGVMHGSKAALPYLLESEGCIINIASIYGLLGGKGAAAYSASKGDVVNFTQQVAVDYADKGVRVNGICPAFVRTPMTDELLEDDAFYEYVRSRTPMERAAEPEEIAPLAAFLASDGASYLTSSPV